MRTMTQRNWKLLFSVVLSLFVGACGSGPQIQKAELAPSDVERLESLAALTRSQSKELQDLQAMVDVLEARIEADDADKPQVIVRKVKNPSKFSKKSVNQPKKTIEVRDTEPSKASETINLPQSEVVADSRHEGMHLYYEGLEKIRSQEFESAITALRKFRAQYPDHVYADRAEFLMTKAHFLNREYGLVIVSANLLESKFPLSFRVPDAIYHKALAYLGLGQKSVAKATLLKLVRGYPTHSLNPIASRELAQLSLGTGSKENHVQSRTEKPPLMSSPTEVY